MYAILRRMPDARSLLLSVFLVGLFSAILGCSGVGTNGEGSGGETGGEDVPTAPADLTATSGDSEVSLNWEAVEAAETYNVYRSTAPTDSVDGPPVNESLSSPSYTDTTAENGTAYYYRVTAVGSEGGESDASNEVQKTPFSDPPDRP